MNAEHLIELMRREMSSGFATSLPVRLQFDAEGCNRHPKQLCGQLQASTVLGSVVSLGRVERE